MFDEHMREKGSISSKLWCAVEAPATEKLAIWGFQVRDGLGRTHQREFRHGAINSEVVLLNLWLDSRTRSIILDGASLTQEEEIDIQPLSAQDIRLRRKFRLTRPLYFALLQGDLSYRLRNKQANSSTIAKVAEQLVQDLEFVHRYLFDGYRGRRIVAFS